MDMKNVAIEGILFSPLNVRNVVEAIGYWRHIGDDRVVTALSWLVEEYRIGYFSIDRVCFMIMRGDI